MATTTTLPDAFVPVTYSAQLAAQGGTPPYTWSVSAGALPPGLSLSAAGLISGAPTVTGSYSFTAQVTDGAAPPAHATAPFSITVAVAGAGPAPRIAGAERELVGLRGQLRGPIPPLRAPSPSRP